MPVLNDTQTGAIGVVDDLPTGVPCPSHGRDNLERKLVRKLDLRMSVILLLYTMNMVSLRFLQTLLGYLPCILDRQIKR